MFERHVEGEWALNPVSRVGRAGPEQMGTGPLGYDRTVILTLEAPPAFDPEARTLTYNATVILKNETVLNDPAAAPVTDIVNNIARAVTTNLVTLEASGGRLPAFNLTEAQLFIDNVGGTLMFLSPAVGLSTSCSSVIGRAHHFNAPLSTP